MVENVKLPDGPGVVHGVGLSQGFIGISVRYGEYKLSDLDRSASVETHWKLSDAEIGALLMGAPLVINLLSARWPPSLISVGDIPQEDHGNSIDGSPVPKQET